MGHAVMQWLVRYAAWVVIIKQRGDDGKTAYERVRGKPFNRRLLGFGEACLGKLPTKGPLHDANGKLNPRWCRAIFLGYDRLSNEFVLHTTGRIVKTRAVQRVSFDRRWSPEALEEVRVSPTTCTSSPSPEWCS